MDTYIYLNKEMNKEMNGVDEQGDEQGDFTALVAQWIRHPTSNREILGSRPSGGIFYSL